MHLEAVLLHAAERGRFLPGPALGEAELFVVANAGRDVLDVEDRDHLPKDRHPYNVLRARVEVQTLARGPRPTNPSRFQSRYGLAACAATVDPYAAADGRE